jgi:uncharacterized integral membrane protein
MMENNESKFHHTNNDDEEIAKSGSGPNISLILFIVVVAAGVTFFVQNSRETKITFLFFDKITAVRWAIIVAVVVGILLDRLLSFWWNRRKKTR